MTRSHQTRSARALFEPAQAGALKLANRIVRRRSHGTAPPKT